MKLDIVPFHLIFFFFKPFNKYHPLQLTISIILLPPWEQILCLSQFLTVSSKNTLLFVFTNKNEFEAKFKFLARIMKPVYNLCINITKCEKPLRFQFDNKQLLKHV